MKVELDLSTLRQKCLYSEFFWSVLSRIWTEYREIQSISRYSVQMRENTDQKNCEYGHFSRSANYVTKANLKKATGVDTSEFAKTDSASLKLDVDELDTDSLKTIFVYLCELSNVLDNGVVKKTVHDKLATKVDAIGTSRFSLKT